MVSYGCRHGDGIHLPLGRHEGSLHLGRSLNGGADQALQEPWVHLQRAVNQVDRSAAQSSGLGQQHTHQARAAIAEEAGRIQGFPGGARTHHKVQTLPITLPTPEGHGFKGH